MAVDEANVDQVTRTLLLLSAPAGTEVMVESVAVTHGEGVVDGDRIVFDGTASGSTVQLIDPDELRTKIAGLPVSEAQAILEGLGTATVNVWPGFLGDLPNDRERITLDVLEASTME